MDVGREDSETDKPIRRNQLRQNAKRTYTVLAVEELDSHDSNSFPRLPGRVLVGRIVYDGVLGRFSATEDKRVIDIASSELTPVGLYIECIYILRYTLPTAISLAPDTQSFVHFRSFVVIPALAPSIRFVGPPPSELANSSSFLVLRLAPSFDYELTSPRTLSRLSRSHAPTFINLLSLFVAHARCHMLINASAILNSTTEPNLNSQKFARAEPSTHNLLPLPSSTLLSPGPYQAVTAPSPSSGLSALDSDFGIPVFPPSTIPPSSAGNGYTVSPFLLAIEDPSTSPIPSSSGLTGSSMATGTTMGTSLPLSISNTLTSRLDVSASPSSSSLSASGTAVPVTPSSASSTVSLSTGTSIFTFTFTPTSVLPFPTASATPPFSSPTSMSTSLSTAPTTSPSPTAIHTSFTPTSASPTTSTSSRRTSEAEAETTTLFVLTTALTTVTLPSPSHSTSTRTINSVIPGHGGTTTYIVTASGSLSTDSAGSAVGG
ncbi:hypothetical protein PAXRUDRAFT_14236 [Paxillus rubicundulus Ve08.2h10]|uniref:Uncharacterized protein n=1 Tax=Paxillus rubicundulus Ve08.2h10 TaxID=930991 RepID=A0A0D0DI54_9AGAM|nr:hypothetical protein PAXRUDRAFT_14236 [Paxillus rubicundulus Ve08.2h10]